MGAFDGGAASDKDQSAILSEIGVSHCGGMLFDLIPFELRIRSGLPGGIVRRHLTSSGGFVNIQ